MSIGSEFSRFATTRGFAKARDVAGPVRVYPPTHTEYRRFKPDEDEVLCLTCPVERLRPDGAGGYDVAETFDRVSFNQSLLAPFIKNWFEKHPTEAFFETRLAQGMTARGNMAWQFIDLDDATQDELTF